MPHRKTIGSWGFNNLGCESNEFGEVTLIFCKRCCEYYSTNATSSSSSTLIKSQVDKFVSGTNVVKKSNFLDHIKKSVSHFNAVKGLNQTLETPPDQTSIVTCVRGMNQKLKDQLVMKFQLAHFIAIHGKPFKLYSDFANFEKEFHNVDLGNSYLSDNSCHESESYPFLSVDIIYDEVKVIVEHFRSLLLATLLLLHDHIIRYISKSSSERCWPITFRNGHDVGIYNLLHVLEMSHCPFIQC